jgi:hypothetical protein
MPTLPPEVLANISGKRLGIQQQRDTALQQLGNQYNTSLFNLGEYQKDAARRVNDQYAAQGIFNSGIRVNEQGRLEKNVGERRGFLGQQYAQGQTGIENQYTNALQGLEDYRTQAMQEATRQELAQQQSAAQIAATQQAADRQSAEQRWYAAMAQNQGGGGAPAAPAGPDQAALDLWNATQYWNAVQLLNATQLWNQAMQSPNRTEFAGSGNPLGMQGARFK